MLRKSLLELSKDELIDIILNQNSVYQSKYIFDNPITTYIAHSLYEFDVPVLITDASLEKPGPFIVYCNKGFEKATGYTEKEVVGKSPRILQGVNTDKEVLFELKKHLFKGEDFRGATVNYKKDGTEFYNQWGIEPIKDLKGNITHYISLHTDITELKAKECELVEQIDQKNAFFSIISHDLKNPLTGFLTLTSLIQDKAGDLTFNKLLELVNTLNKAANSLNDLLTNLLIWSRAQTSTFEVSPMNIDIFDKITSVINLYSTQLTTKNLSIINEVSQNVIVESDPFIFDTIIRNLINNAIKFSKAGNEIKINYDFKDNVHYLSVIDNGVGIKAEIIPDLFNIAKKITTLGTSKEKGTGLGLKLCRDLARKQNSDILVESELGKGSKFTFKIDN